MNAMVVDLTHTSTHYQRTVRRLTADIRAGRIERMSYAELQAAIDALWAARQKPTAPDKPVEYGRIPF